MREVEYERKFFSCSRPALLRLIDLYRFKDFKAYLFTFHEILKRKREGKAIDSLQSQRTIQHSEQKVNQSKLEVITGS